MDSCTATGRSLAAKYCQIAPEGTSVPACWCVISQHGQDVSIHRGRFQAWVFWQFQYVNNPLPPRIRAMIINYDPTQPDALTISEFCKTQKISRSIFYRIRSRASTESASALHPRSRAPHHPARRYGPEIVNELVRIRKQLKSDGWDYGPKTIHYEATIQATFPGGRVPRSPRSPGCSRALATLTGIRASDRNPPTCPLSGQRPWRCGSWTPSNIGPATARSAPSTS